MTNDENKKAPKPLGLQGLLISVCYRSRPLTPGASNNNHDFNDSDASRLQKIRAVGNLDHGRKPVSLK